MFGKIGATLNADNKQRSFGRVTLHLPVFVVIQKHTVIAENSGTQAFDKNGKVSGIKTVASQKNLSGKRIIACAGYLIQNPARHNFLNGHLVFRQRAGLVRTDHRGGAQRLHRRQLTDNGPSFGHA